MERLVAVVEKKKANEKAAVMEELIILETIDSEKVEAMEREKEFVAK